MSCQDRKGSAQCRSGDNIEITTCDDENTWFVFRNRDGRDSQLKIAGTELCMEMVGEKDYWGRKRKAIEVRECSTSDERQFFRAEWGDEKFSIKTANNDGCLSQDHHPREGEAIFSEDCDRADYQDTVYWFFY